MSFFTLTMILIGPVLAIAIAALVRRGLGGEQKEIQRILQVGLPAHARVLQLQHTGSSVSFGADRHLRVVLLLEIHPQGRPPYMAHAQQLISELYIPSIQPGAWIHVRVDPASPTTKIAIASATSAASGGAGVGFDASAAVDKGTRRALVMTGALTVVGLIPLAGAFVDWSAFGLSGDGDAPEGGYCKALVRCCDKLDGDSGNCDAWADLPGSGCKSAYESYQQSAKARGMSCE